MIKKLLEEYSPQEILSGICHAYDQAMQAAKGLPSWSSVELKRLGQDLKDGVRIKRTPATTEQMAELIEAEGLFETLNALRKELLGKHPEKFVSDTECGGNSGMLPVIVTLNQNFNQYSKFKGPMSKHIEAMKAKAEKMDEERKANTPPPPEPEPEPEATEVELMLNQHEPEKVAASFAAAAGPRLQPVEDCITLCQAYRLDLSTSAPQSYRILKTRLANSFKGESTPSLVKKFAKILDACTIQDVAGEIAKAIPGSAKKGTQRPQFIIRDLQEVEKVGRRLNCPIL